MVGKRAAAVVDFGSAPTEARDKVRTGSESATSALTAEADGVEWPANVLRLLYEVKNSVRAENGRPGAVQVRRARISGAHIARVRGLMSGAQTWKSTCRVGRISHMGRPQSGAGSATLGIQPDRWPSGVPHD